MIRRMRAGHEGIVVEKDPIPPLDLSKGEVPIKMRRVLLTPLDSWILGGILDRKFIGTLGYGRVLEKQLQSIPGEASIYPTDCSTLPPIGAEGVGSEIFPYPADRLRKPPSGLRFPEMLFIYDVLYTITTNSEGRTLVVGGDGLQSYLLAKIFSDATFFGLQAKLKGLNGISLISPENLKGTEWDTIIVNTLSFSRVAFALRETRWKKLIVNPFIACLHGSIPLPSLNKFSVVFAFPSDTILDENIPYGEMEKYAIENGFIEEIRIEELASDRRFNYLAVVLEDEE